APAVIGVVGQRLVRRICPECRVEYVPPVEERAFYEEIGGIPKEGFFHGEGGNFCSGTGYQERIGGYGGLRLTQRMKGRSWPNAPHSEIRSLAIKEGMRPLRDEALRLVASDVTTIAEILRSVYPL